METTKIEGVASRHEAEHIAPGALRLDSLIGKPIVIYKDNKRREVGTITSATADLHGIKIEGGLTDEELIKFLAKKRLEGFSVGG